MAEQLFWLLLVSDVAIIIMVVIIIGKLFIGRQQDVRAHFESLRNDVVSLDRGLKDDAAKNRLETGNTAHLLRKEIFEYLSKFNDAIFLQMDNNMDKQIKQLESFSSQLQVMMQTNEQRLKYLQDDNAKKLDEMRQVIDTKVEKMRETVETQLKTLREDNGKKLEEMRKTVDEKLHETLEKRLGESFKQVSERLEQVHKGLGEMQTLASGVGDLKRVLTNVKTRGIWGEINLGNLLEQILTKEQYAQNVATKKGSNDRVEFAIKLPGKDAQDSFVWLPIDAKFPQEDYQRLLEAQEQANPLAAEEAGKALENRIKLEAKSIAEKYVSVPQTTEFAILFLPTEGLYAEVLRRPGLFEILTLKHKIVLTGPTTLAALLNSLQMGFRTLAVEKRSSDVWNLLGAVKTQFSEFGVLLDKTSKKLQESSNSIAKASQKSRAIESKLKKVQELPDNAAAEVLLGADFDLSEEVIDDEILIK